MSGSNDGFLINGHTIADFKLDGKFPDDKQLFTISVMYSSTDGKTSTKRFDGIGSLAQVAFLEPLIIFSTSSCVARANDSNLFVAHGRIQFCSFLLGV